MSDQIIFVISNASTHFATNNLSNFTNILNKKILLPERENWHFAIESVGLSNSYENFIFPENAKVPHIFFVENNSAINFEDKTNQIFFPISKYSTAYLISVFETINIKYSNFISLKLHESRKVKIARGSTQTSDHLIYIHKTTLQNLGFKPQKLQTHCEYVSSKKLNFKDECFFRFTTSENIPNALNTNSTFINDQIKVDFTQKIPQLIKIKCDNIESSINNTIHDRILGMFSPEKNVDYCIKQFKTKEYFPLSTTLLSSIKINFVDESNNNLHLLPGPASFVKLHLRKMIEQTKIVRISSESTQNFTTNTNSSFTVLLPSALTFYGKWKSALSSISFRPDFATLPRKCSLSVSYKKSLQKADETLTFEAGTYSLEDLVKKINDHFTNNATYKTVYLNLNVRTGRYTLLCGPHIGSEIKIDKDILLILGYDFQELSLTSKPYVKFNDLSYRKSIEFTELPNEKALHPLYIIVYADFVESSIVGSGYSRVLKIIPVSEEKNRKLIEFEHLEFFNVENTNMTTIKVELRSHDGELIKFNNDEKLFMNILFQKFK